MRKVIDGDTVQQLPDTYKTETIYLPSDMDLESVPLHILRRGMCPRSGKSISVCLRDCHAPCRWGMALMLRLRHLIPTSDGGNA